MTNVNRMLCWVGLLWSLLAHRACERSRAVSGVGAIHAGFGVARSVSVDGLGG